MDTKIKTVHEEQSNDRNIGVLYNYSVTEGELFSDSMIYLYDKGIYVFFETITYMIDYVFYGNHKNSNKRAYMEEKDFDVYYDNVITGKFTDCLKWTTE